MPTYRKIAAHTIGTSANPKLGFLFVKKISSLFLFYNLGTDLNLMIPPFYIYFKYNLIKELII